MVDSGSRFAWERAMLADPAVRGSALLVLLTLATHHDRHTATATVSRATLARETGLSESTVARALADVVVHPGEDTPRGKGPGYLFQLRKGHRLGDGTTVSSTYELRLPLRLTDDTYSEGSTAHPRHVEVSSTCQDAGLNVSPDPAQRVTDDTPSGVSPSEVPPSGKAAMRDYPIDSADARERADRCDEGAPADLVAARAEVERWHPTLRPDEVDAVLSLLGTRARHGYSGAFHRGLRESCVADVLAERKRASNGLAWFDALTPADRATYEAAARRSLAEQDDHDPAPAVVRARVIRMFHTAKAGAAA